MMTTLQSKTTVRIRTVSMMNLEQRSDQHLISFYLPRMVATTK